MTCSTFFERLSTYLYRILRRSSYIYIYIILYNDICVLHISTRCLFSAGLPRWCARRGTRGGTRGGTEVIQMWNRSFPERWWYNLMYMYMWYNIFSMFKKLIIWYMMLNGDMFPEITGRYILYHSIIFYIHMTFRWYPHVVPMLYDAGGLLPRRGREAVEGTSPKLEGKTKVCFGVKTYCGWS